MLTHSTSNTLTHSRQATLNKHAVFGTERLGKFHDIAVFTLLLVVVLGA
jgi:hypothetical protein